jgi:hypothetical protein
MLRSYSNICLEGPRKTNKTEFKVVAPDPVFETETLQHETGVITMVDFIVLLVFSLKK